MNNNDTQAIGILTRTLTRPLVTLAFSGAAIAAAFVFKNPEFIYAAGGTVIGFWFSDRAKEQESQRLAYGAAQDRSNTAATKANIEIIEVQNKFPPRQEPPPSPPPAADARRMGYQT